jgi:hypothetical protein
MAQGLPILVGKPKEHFRRSLDRASARVAGCATCPVAVRGRQVVVFSDVYAACRSADLVALRERHGACRLRLVATPAGAAALLVHFWNGLDDVLPTCDGDELPSLLSGRILTLRRVQQVERRATLPIVARCLREMKRERFTLGITDLAVRCGISNRHLLREFRSCLGQSRRAVVAAGRADERDTSSRRASACARWRASSASAGRPTCATRLGGRRD